MSPAPLSRSTPRLAADSGLAWATWPADLVTPVRLFLALRGAGREVCLLESVEGPARLARYSFVGVDPTQRLRGRDGRSVLTTAEGREELALPVHLALREVAGRRRTESGVPGLPPFTGGWIGWLAYEWATCLEPRVPRAAADPWEVPDGTFDLYETVVAIDHAAQRVYVMKSCASAADHTAAQEAIDAVAADMLAEPEMSGGLVLQGDLKPAIERERFERGVQKLRGDIAQGEIFQAVLSQRFEQDFEGDPFTLYRVLRLVNPSPHMFFYESDGLTLIGSSPERLVSVQGRLAENRPIAGTRPRGQDPEEDERLAVELLNDPKEHAEHDMLVDLARNDLGRVSRIGTVRVVEHAVIEKFARVQHIVSRVQGELAAGQDAIDALAACFPAGTLSGAPKVRAMELLAGLEPETRGPYGGAFGYLDNAGNLDVAIIIRSFVARGNKLTLQSGAGVVFDSDPAREYEETLHKGRALFEAARQAGSETFRIEEARA